GRMRESAIRTKGFAALWGRGGSATIDGGPAQSNGKAIASPPRLGHALGERIVLLTDWLPPEFSAVSQYALMIAREGAESGAKVPVMGTRTTDDTNDQEPVSVGTLRVIGIKRPPIVRTHWRRRLQWALSTNVLLVLRAWGHLWRSQTIRFSGSPPFMLP